MRKFRIDTKAGREKLEPRSSAYYKKIDKGKSIGYLKGKTGGSWVARLITPGENQQFHKIHVQNTDPQKVYGEALKKAQEWFDLKSRGVQTDYLLNDAIEDYILYLRTEKSNDVWKTAANVLKNIPPQLKNTPVYKLTTHQLDRWRTFVVKQSDDPETVRKSKNTSNRRWSDLRACLNRAFKQGYVADRTAWERITPYKKVIKGRQIFWTPEEVERILEESRKLNPDYYRLIKGALLTGARIGELRSLKVKDLLDDILQIRAGKTGHRDMFLSSAATRFLKLSSRNKTPEAWLLDYHGRQWPEDYHHKLFRKIRQLAGINPESTFYCARHFYISRGLQAGITPDLIAKNCGTSPAMIHQFYGKFTRKAQKEAAAKIGAALGIQ